MAGRHLAKRIVPIALILIAGGAIAFYAWNSSRPKPLVLSGTIEAHVVSVGSLVGGRIAAIHVVEGTPVRSGQLLVSLETDPIDRQIDQQKAVVAASVANLDKVIHGYQSEDIQKSAAIAANANREAERFRKLYHDGIASREQYDQAATQAQTANADLLKLRRGSRPEDIAAARADVTQQQKRLEVLLQQKSEGSVIAPLDGIVQTVSIRPGDLVAPNQGIVEIVENRDLWVRVFVPETVLGLVKIGMPATITVDTFPGKKYPGRVVQINEKGEYTPRNIQTRSQRADQVFGVKVAISPNQELKPGMASDVDLGVKGKVE